MAGTITASCGHTLDGIEELVDVRWKEEACDPATGFSNAVAYGTFCRHCAEEFRKRGDLIETDEQEREWIEAGNRIERIKDLRGMRAALENTLGSTQRGDK